MDSSLRTKPGELALLHPRRRDPHPGQEGPGLSPQPAPQSTPQNSGNNYLRAGGPGPWRGWKRSVGAGRTVWAWKALTPTGRASPPPQRRSSGHTSRCPSPASPLLVQGRPPRFRSGLVPASHDQSSWRDAWLWDGDQSPLQMKRPAGPRGSYPLPSRDSSRTALFQCCADHGCQPGACGSPLPPSGQPLTAPASAGASFLRAVFLGSTAQVQSLHMKVSLT